MSLVCSLFCSFASVRQIFMWGWLLRSHCFIWGVVLSGHSSIGVANGNLSCTSTFSSCVYNAVILASKAFFITALVRFFRSFPCKISFLVIHRVYKYAKVVRIIARIHFGSPDASMPSTSEEYLLCA